MDNKHEEQKKDEQNEKEQGEIDEFIVDNVPAKLKKTAASLLKSLRVDGRIEWGPSGAISIDGNTVRRGNIIDLVNYTARSKKANAPKGIEQFAGVLHTASIPREFIGNSQFRRDIENHTLAPSKHSSITTSTPKTSARSRLSEDEEERDDTFFDAIRLSKKQPDSEAEGTDTPTPTRSQFRKLRPRFPANAKSWLRLPRK